MKASTHPAPVVRPTAKYRGQVESCMTASARQPPPPPSWHPSIPPISFCMTQIFLMPLSGGGGGWGGWFAYLFHLTATCYTFPTISHFRLLSPSKQILSTYFLLRISASTLINIICSLLFVIVSDEEDIQCVDVLHVWLGRVEEGVRLVACGIWSSRFSTWVQRGVRFAP
jgi:hypothetical protein